MKLEIMVLMLLRGKANIPEIMAMGTCPTGHFIILELVGRNLSDLRRQLPHKRLTPGTLYRSMIQANIPEIMAMGTCPTGHFIILELVGRNLSDLRRQLPHKRLTPGTLYRSMIQVLLKYASYKEKILN
ncbi:unnamed protein product [Strongylus vulgaris]|uniref:Protein kinase domain-containing protein n=1 Tax=Strongylus vulgaris TaxID=40348 RepID=A0A3P7JRB7_STRVU|nr:unnamed protein product [Strongylus vulgaris]